MTSSSRSTPVWIVVVAVLILLPITIWALYLALNVVAAMSIGAILLVAAFIGLFIWVKKRSEQRAH